MSLMPCLGFSMEQQSTFILTSKITLVSYYLSKRFVVFEKKECTLDKGPLNAKNKMPAVDKNENDNFLTYKTAIPSIAKSLTIFIYSMIYMRNMLQLYIIGMVKPKIYFTESSVGSILKKLTILII